MPQPEVYAIVAGPHIPNPNQTTNQPKHVTAIQSRKPPSLNEQGGRPLHGIDSLAAGIYLDVKSGIGIERRVVNGPCPVAGHVFDSRRGTGTVNGKPP